MTNKGEEQTPHEQFYGKLPEYARSLQTFGEIAIATNPAIRGQPKAKLTNHGDVSMFLGYSEDHAEGVFHFLKLKTNKVTHSKDATWMGQMWGEFYKIKPAHQVIQVNDEEVKEPKVKIKKFDVDDLEEVKMGKEDVKKGGKEVNQSMPMFL